MSKGSGRRKENTALVEANWPFPDRKADQAPADQMRAENLMRSVVLQCLDKASGEVLREYGLGKVAMKVTCDSAGVSVAAIDIDEMFNRNTEQDAKDG